MPIASCWCYRTGSRSHFLANPAPIIPCVRVHPVCNLKLIETVQKSIKAADSAWPNATLWSRTHIIEVLAVKFPFNSVMGCLAQAAAQATLRLISGGPAPVSLQCPLWDESGHKVQSSSPTVLRISESLDVSTDPQAARELAGCAPSPRFALSPAWARGRPGVVRVVDGPERRPAIARNVSLVTSAGESRRSTRLARRVVPRLDNLAITSISV